MPISRRKFVLINALASFAATLPGWAKAFEQSPRLSEDIIEGNLYKGFINPPTSAKPFVRWWWNGNRLTEKEILRELDLLKDAGIGGVEINSIKFPANTDTLGLEAFDWLSEDWLNMLQTAVKGVHERGMMCDIIVGSGWPFGGQFLSKDEQTQILTFETSELEGPKTYTFHSEDLLKNVDLKIHSRNKDFYKELVYLRLAPYKMDAFGIDKDFTDEIKKETITVHVPEGRHVLYYLVKLTGFQAVIQGAPGANGPVLNHYNKAAVEKYLNRMSETLTPRLGDLGKSFRAMFCDSLELEGANWADDMLEEFKVRRGYDLNPYLPYILYKTGEMGNPVAENYGSKFTPEIQDQIKRVRYDFHITRLEVFKERFISVFQNWCRNHHVKSRVQAYGMDYHPLEGSMQIDIPECETWIQKVTGSKFDPKGSLGRAYTNINKFVSSGARLAGKKVISCEEITDTQNVFFTDLAKIKVAGDQSNLSGVTHSILHGFNYSPKEAPFPGWVQYGTFFNERSPWWPYVKLWTDYKARLSYVFQNSELFSDVALLHPLADLWMNIGPQRDPFPKVSYPDYQFNVWEAIHQNGNGCDYVSESILQKAKFQKGILSYGNRSYKALLLMEVEAILPETAVALEQYVSAGGTLIFIGKEPVKSPGLVNARQNNKLVLDTIQKIKNQKSKSVGFYPSPSGNLISWYRNMQDKFTITPYMKLTNPNAFISQVYYKNEDKDIFFISNYHLTESYEGVVKFDIHNKTAHLWNPENGEKYLLPSSNGKLTLKLGRGESKLIVFDKDKSGEKLDEPIGNAVSAYQLNIPWSLQLNHINGQKSQFALTNLIDFKEEPQLASFAGSVLYNSSFSVQEPEKYNYIDLGEVNAISEVFINEVHLGVRWYGQHRYALKGGLRKGENKIRMKVTTGLGNYSKSLKDNIITQAWTSGQELQPMGILGPIKLL